MDELNKPARENFRVSVSDKKLIGRAAKKAKLRRSEFLRRAVMGEVHRVLEAQKSGGPTPPQG